MTANEIRAKYEKEIAEELERVKALLATRGITERKPDEEFDRIVVVETPYDYGCRIKSTCFKVPEGIDLKMVVWWFVHKTKFYDCTVFLNGRQPTTIGCDEVLNRFFR